MLPSRRSWSGADIRSDDDCAAGEDDDELLALPINDAAAGRTDGQRMRIGTAGGGDGETTDGAERGAKSSPAEAMAGATLGCFMVGRLLPCTPTCAPHPPRPRPRHLQKVIPESECTVPFEGCSSDDLPASQPTVQPFSSPDSSSSRARRCFRVRWAGCRSRPRCSRPAPKSTTPSSWRPGCASRTDDPSLHHLPVQLDHSLP